ncbi:DC-STAMP domain-containing protein 2 [Lutzomyia longipalpis]|uniref:DC-STAMP domain-containing protein 2 n=1 Tax=Lutzomyia longipalpis TaxID=7200 RepID=UPI0024834589|nr:DC-STAMP domain-containing protein 2 [Lutzomyia longipalpis]
MIEKCKEDYEILGFICNLNYLLQPFCIAMEVLGFICVAIDYVGDSALALIEQLTEEFSKVIKKMFYFYLQYDSDFDFETSSSKNWSQIRQSISQDLKKRTDSFISVVGFMEFLSLIFILWLFYKYQTQYLRRDNYKNYYITQHFYEIEERNSQLGRDLVLPLRGEENDRFTDLRALWFIRYERSKLLRSFPFLLISNVQILTILFTDYILHWILAAIRDYESQHLPAIASGGTVVKVTGRGSLSTMYKNIAGEFEPFLRGFSIDFRECIPDPSPPNWERFRITIFLIVICWIFLLVEPYSVRAQQYVMDSFHPERARKRSAWLHEEILRRRRSFLAIARQNLMQHSQGKSGEYHKEFFRTIWERLRHTRLVNFFLGQQWQEFCLSCAATSNQDVAFESCSQLHCRGIFCSKCLSDENFSCPLCNISQHPKHPQHLQQ